MKLLQTNPTNRIYQLDFKVKRVLIGGFISARRIVNIGDVFKEDPIKLKPEFEFAEDISESIDKICISDAHTHTERLVFPVFMCRNKETGEEGLTWRCNNIAGRLTMMIHGGDSKAVYPDRVYIRYLRIIQNLK